MSYCFMFGISHHVFWWGDHNTWRQWKAVLNIITWKAIGWLALLLWRFAVRYTDTVLGTGHCVRHIWNARPLPPCDCLSLHRQILLAHSYCNTKTGPTHTFRCSQFLKLVFSSNFEFSHVSKSFGIMYYEFSSPPPCVLYTFCFLFYLCLLLPYCHFIAAPLYFIGYSVS